MGQADRNHLSTLGFRMKYDPNIEGRYGIKLVDEHRVRKEANFSTRESFEYIQAVVNHFIKNPDPMVVPVYSFEVLQEPSDRYGIFIYAYEMMRLGMLDNYERDILESCHAYYHTGIPYDVRNDLLARGWREYPKLMKFMNVVFSQQRYTDIHSGNFMKDQEGEYRIIDLEGFNGPPLSEAKNDWITR